MALHDVLRCSGCHKARRQDDRRCAGGFGEGGGRVTTFTNVPKHVEDGLDKLTLTPSRRNFLKSAGLLVVSFSAAGTDPLITGASAQTPAGFQGTGPYHDPDFHQLDSWIVIHEDNTATFYVGKTDCGQGTGTYFRQLMSDELDIICRKDVPDRKSTRLNSSHL